MPHQDAAPHLDSLLQPSLAERRAHPGAADRPRPWRLSSQLNLVAAGALPLTLIAVLNARRLGLATREQLLIAALGLAGLAVELLVAGAISAQAGGAGVVVRSGVAAACGAMWLIQRKADRIHHYHEADDAYAGLTGPGLLAAAALGIPELVLVLSILGGA